MNSGRYQKGHIVSQEVRKKLSEAQLGEKNHNFGKHFSEERKRKISEATKGRVISEESRKKASESSKGMHYSPKSEFKKNCIPWNKGTKGLQVGWSKGKKLTAEHIKNMVANRKSRIGYKHSEETKEKIRVSNNRPETIKQHRERSSGSNSSTWKGGITPEIERIRKSLEYRMWRTSIFERDDYTCVWCGTRSGKDKVVVLNADHIKSFANFPELRFDINNGRTLCVPCHKTTDTYLGKSRRLENINL